MNVDISTLDDPEEDLPLFEVVVGGRGLLGEEREKYKDIKGEREKEGECDSERNGSALLPAEVSSPGRSLADISSREFIVYIHATPNIVRERDVLCIRVC